MLFLASATNIMWGIAGLAGDRHLEERGLVIGDLTTWAIVLIAFAVVQGVTAVMIMRRSPTGATIGIVIAAAGILAQLAAFGAYPLWSGVVIAIDALVIYGLAVHGTDG